METSQDTKMSSEKPANGNKKKAFTVLFVLFVIAGAAGGWLYLNNRDFQTTDDAFIDGHIIQVSPHVAGHIKTVSIVDNQDVAEGQLLVEIDDRDFQTRINSARAALDGALATVEQLKAMIDSSRISLEMANTDFKRYESLLTSGAITQQEHDRMKTRAVGAQAELNTLTKQIVAAEARQAEAKSALEQAELFLSYTKITAPAAGRVTKRSAEPGGYVQIGQPLLAIVQPNVWVVANFKETQLTHIRAGQSVEVEIDAYPGHFLKAHVDSIQAGTGSRFSLLPPENATGNFVKVVQRVPVKIVFDEPSDKLASLAPGMSVVPRVKIR